MQGGYYWNILESASGSTPELTIRDGSRIEAGLHVQCSHKVHIGRNVKIGPNVSLTDSTADADQPGYPAWAQPANNINTCGELIVGDGSIIGAHAVINRAVKIGKFSIIEPNSVVVDHIPSFLQSLG
ncbi:acyltransferase [Paenibacillus rhizoplanae]